MYKKCIICDSLQDELVLNNIPMRRCRQCGLIWSKNFDMSLQYYAEQDVGLSPGKLKRRLSNCKDRVKISRKYADLNNLCDIGCGEGMFLKVLQDFGYKNVMGIEPSDKTAEFTKENHLNIQKGTIKDVGSIINRHNIHTITMFHLIEHLENPLESLKSIYNNLTTGSFIIIETPDINAYSLRERNYEYSLTIYPEHNFYFNKSNLKKLLEKIGFNIIARGKRDFDPNNLNIRESLFRLGFLQSKYSYTAEGHKSAVKAGGLYSFRFKNLLIGKIKSIIRFMLSRMVIISGRQDFMWIIARK